MAELRRLSHISKAYYGKRRRAVCGSGGVVELQGIMNVLYHLFSGLYNTFVTWGASIPHAIVAAPWGDGVRRPFFKIYRSTEEKKWVLPPLWSRAAEVTATRENKKKVGGWGMWKMSCHGPYTPGTRRRRWMSDTNMTMILHQTFLYTPSGNMGQVNTGQRRWNIMDIIVDIKIL